MPPWRMAGWPEPEACWTATPTRSSGGGWPLVESEQAVDPTSALEHAEQALAVARQTRDSDLELAALGRAGLAEIALGRIEAGVTRFDEGMAASAAGEAADLRTLGDLYCAANLAAEITLDMSRFEQWTGVVMGFMERTGHPDLLTFCGTCCAEVYRAAGRWEDGEGWLTRTLSQLERSGQKARCVHPATRLASFRVAQGRLEEADQLLRGYEDLPEAVQAMVALHLARGQTALAAARLHRRLNEIGRDNLVTVPLLAQLVEVQLAQPDLGGAAETAEALAAIAARSGHVRAQAEAELALGSVRAAAGDASAREHLDRSLGLFVRLRMPHAAGRVHLALARTLAETDPDTAVEEARQALRTFEDLGATHDADRAAGVPSFPRGRGANRPQARGPAQQAGARGPSTPRAGPDQRRDRGPPVHQHQDRGDPRWQPVRQAPAPQPGGGGRLRLSAPPRRHGRAVTLGFSSESVVLPILVPPSPATLGSVATRGGEGHGQDGCRPGGGAGPAGAVPGPVRADRGGRRGCGR